MNPNEFVRGHHVEGGEAHKAPGKRTAVDHGFFLNLPESNPRSSTNGPDPRLERECASNGGQPWTAGTWVRTPKKPSFRLCGFSLRYKSDGRSRCTVLGTRIHSSSTTSRSMCFIDSRAKWICNARPILERQNKTLPARSSVWLLLFGPRMFVRVRPVCCLQTPDSSSCERVESLETSLSHIPTQANDPAQTYHV